MADRFSFDTPHGKVTTNSPAAAIRMRYAEGYTEARRSEKVDQAAEKAKTADPPKK